MDENDGKGMKFRRRRRGYDWQKRMIVGVVYDTRERGGRKMC